MATLLDYLQSQLSETPATITTKSKGGLRRSTGPNPAYTDLINRINAIKDTPLANAPAPTQAQSAELTTVDKKPTVGQRLSQFFGRAADVAGDIGRSLEPQISEQEKYLRGLTQEQAQQNIANEIRQQQRTMAAQGINWSTGIPVDEVINDMAAKIAATGAKSINDLTDKFIQTGQDPDTGAGQGRTVLWNARTQKEIPSDYAFAGISSDRTGTTPIVGGTWSGTFAGPGSTRYNVNFVNGVPVFSAQQQATVKSGLEQIAPTLVGLGATALLGPAGYGLVSAPIAGAIGGGLAGLGKTGDISDALKGAVLGGALGYGQEALFGADAATAASDLAKIEASMGVPSFATATTPLAVENIAAQLTPEAQALMQPSVSMIPPAVFNEPVLVPSTSLTGTLAQPPLAVENIAAQLTPEAQGLLTTVPFTPAALPAEIPPIYQTLPITPPVVETPAAMLSPETQALMASTGPVLGSAEKAALYGASGYGPGLTPGEAPIIESVATSMGPGKEVSGLQVAKDIITSAPGALQQYATTALTTLGIDPDVVNKIVGATGGATGGAKTTTQPGGGLGGVVLGSLLGKQAPAAPQAGVSRGQAVNIVSPIESLLAPKLVQQRPISLL